MPDSRNSSSENMCAGKLISASQREKEIKFELAAAITSPDPGAIRSGNCHGDYFGRAFGISLYEGDAARTSCFGFGLERTTLALLSRHGSDLASWPPQVRSSLNLASAEL
jgi:hypothetical protein